MLGRLIHTMGTEVRILVAEEDGEGVLASEVAEAELHDFNSCLSRFIADSELSLFNENPSELVPASELLREAVGAGIWGAERTGGLVDPTLLSELRALGYSDTREGAAPEPLATALSSVPDRGPAGPNPAAAWRSIEVLDEEGAIRRPPGLLFDTGGTGKGLAADRVARRLHGLSRFAIDCGGDVLVGGRDPGSEEVRVEIRHPISGRPADVLTIARGAVATSGIDVHLWRAPDNRFGHHLIDPATGESAWTGVICAAARAPSALEADVLAKAAILAGPSGAAEHLAEHGGLIVLDDGRVENFGPLHDRPRIRVSPPN